MHAPFSVYVPSETLMSVVSNTRNEHMSFETFMPVFDEVADMLESLYMWNFITVFAHTNKKDDIKFCGSGKYLYIR